MTRPTDDPGGGAGDEVPPDELEIEGAAVETLRLTFRAGAGRVELVSSERVDMVCPPKVDELARAGQHGGFWLELRDAGNETLAQHVLAEPLTQSVEVFEPDGGVRREFGPVADTVFEVLLPAEPAAASVALIGEPEVTVAGRDGAGTRELASFALPGGDR